MDFPNELRYTREHEWVKIEETDRIATIGVTDYAQDKLGDIVYVELPEEGSELQQEEPFGSVESVKAVSDLYSPLSGTVLESNDALPDSPEEVNGDPYGEAWMIRIQYSEGTDLSHLMSAEEYQQFVASQEEEEA